RSTSSRRPDTPSRPSAGGAEKPVLGPARPPRTSIDRSGQPEPAVRTLPRPRAPRHVVGVLAGVLLAMAGALLLPAAAGAQTSPGSPAPVDGAGAADPGVVSVVTVNGLIDPIVADFMRQSIDDAERAEVKAIIFQVDLQGSVVPDAELAAILD